ncbi:MAG TPA: chloride channel protein [Terriglobales bacterium]|nr:chloride channel protein [Terriglobales bacterium]
MSAPSMPTAAAAGGSAKERRLLGEDQLFLLLSILIGVFAGLAVVCFRMAIDAARWILFGSGLMPPRGRVVLVPGAVGLLVAFLVVRFFPRVRGSGVNQTKSALYIYDGYIPGSTIIGKFITSALAIGSGQSLGPEDPSLQIGAGLASLVGRRLKLSRHNLRLIAPVGAAAGLAAAFNTPIAAVLFVIEEVIGRWSAGVLGAVVLAAVSSVVVERWFLGAEPLFRAPGYRLESPGELAAYAILGVVAGLASTVFVKSIQLLRPWLKALPRWTQYLLPALAGVLIGLIGRQYPQVMGAGYEYIDQALHDQYTWEVLGILAGLKILATVLSFSSGTPGGLFAPTLFIGAMVGGAVGGVERLLYPHFTGPLGAYALVGMGALFAGILRAPMTSVFLVLEISGNYAIILPVIISNALAYLISRSLQPTPIFDLLSRQDGIDLPSLEQDRERAVLRVEDAMHAPTPQMALRLDDLPPPEGVESLPGEFFLVQDRSGYWGGMSKARLLELASDRASGARPQELPHLHPDHSLDVAMRRMGEWPLLPVVHRADGNKLVGVVSLADILETYRNRGPALDELAEPAE